MTEQRPASTYRPSDFLCMAHRDTALASWPGAPNRSPRCDECDALYKEIKATVGSALIPVRLLPDLDADEFRWATAIHEAAHALVGRDVGMPIAVVTVVPDPQEETGGHVIWGDWDEMPLHYWAAMVWADQEAQVRWLQALGLNSTANVIDARYGGADDLHKIRTVCERTRSDPVPYRLVAQLRVSRLWPEIVSLADALLVFRTMTGEEVDAWLA